MRQAQPLPLTSMASPGESPCPMRFFRISAPWALAAWGITAISGCGSNPSDTTGSGGDGGSGATTTTTSNGGNGGTGGTAGAGGGTACEPGETKSCYSGPEGTEGVGLCKAGVQTCKANGEEFGPCTGEVVPAEETCSTSGDDDCDGLVNEGGPDCSCIPGDIKSCYSGAADTEGVGPCIGGTQACNSDGMGYGECVGEVTPQPETCDTTEDDDCDGKVNEEGPGCVCPAGELVDCYLGPEGTKDVGDCKGGKALCSEDGKSLGPCEGQVTPQVETCNLPGDEDCDGQANEEGPGCQCVPGTMVACYTGPANTLGIGACKAGLQECSSQGMPAGTCVGEVTPVAETCATPEDEDCDGLVNEDGEGCSCVPGSTKACYSGPMGTQGVGTCKAGTQTCAGDGLSYGPCEGEVLPAAENCNTAANEDCSTVADCGTQLWAKAFGAASDQQAFAIARDAQDNTILTGRFTGFMTFGGNMLVSPNGYDIFVVKFDPDGNHVWSKRFGDNSIYQEGFDVATDANGNVFVTGYFDGTINFGGGGLTTGGLTDIFLIKLDSDGNHVWSKSFPAPGPQYGASIAVDPMGDVALLASGYNTLDFGGGGLVGAGDYDIFLAKFDGENGNHLWSKRYGSPSDDRGVAVTADASGNFVWSGRSDGTLDFGAGNVPSNGALDALLVKVDPDGGLLWAKRIGNQANQFGGDVVTDAQSNIIVTGGFEGTVNLGGGALSSVGAIDVFVAKLNSAGNHVWSKSYGALGANISTAGLAVLPSSGDVIAVGSLDGSVNFGAGALTSSGGADALILHLGAANGSLVWSRLYGGAGAQQVSSVAAGAMDHLLVTGGFEQTIDFGGGNLTSLGALDIFLAKLAP